MSRSHGGGSVAGRPFRLIEGGGDPGFDERAHHDACATCGSTRWVQRVAVYDERADRWSANRTCRRCGDRWLASWVDLPPGPARYRR